jgi:hypothetical protein
LCRSWSAGICALRWLRVWLQVSVRGECGTAGERRENGTYLVVLVAVVRSCDVGSVHF